MQKVNLTCWSLQLSPKEQPQDKNKIINETREDCVLNRPMVDKENHVCSMGHKIAFILWFSSTTLEFKWNSDVN